MLEFSISNQTLTRLDEMAVVADSANYLFCHFTFSSDWDNVTPVATFGHSDVAEPITVMIEDGVCQVPWEVIQPYGFYMAVYGSGQGSDGTFTHIPTDTVTVEVGESGVSENLGPLSPTQSMYDSLMTEIRECESAAVEAKTSALASARSAAGNAESAEYYRNVAENAQQECVARASEAGCYAEEARQAASQISAETALAVAARQELDDAVILCKSYAVGTEDYRVIGGAAPCPWSSWKFSIGSIGMEANHRYLVSVDDVWYEGISHMLTTVGDETADPLGVSDDEELTSETPEGDEGGELTSETTEGDEGEELTPETPGGDDTDQPIDPDDPVTSYEERIELKVGPLTIVQWNNGSATGTDFTTTDTSVRNVWIYTDGHDNGKYYMEQAQAAMETAKQTEKNCERILEQILALQGE